MKPLPNTIVIKKKRASKKLICPERKLWTNWRHLPKEWMSSSSVISIIFKIKKRMLHWERMLEYLLVSFCFYSFLALPKKKQKKKKNETITLAKEKFGKKPVSIQNVLVVAWIGSLLFTRLIDKLLGIVSRMSVSFMFGMSTRFIMSMLHSFGWKSFLNLKRKKSEWTC